MALNPNSKWPTQTTAPSGDYPYGSAQNITTPGDGTGTPFVKDLVDDWFGFQQEVLQRAGITPSGNPDHAGDSDVFDGLRKTIGGYPGHIITTCCQSDPASLGIRALALQGQTVAIASYSDLVTATYVGDANNGDTTWATGFYKTSDTPGTVRNTAGPYFVLPDFRGYFLRGLDLAGGSVDPNAASRFCGSFQTSAVREHTHEVYRDYTGSDVRMYLHAIDDPGASAPSLYALATAGDNLHAVDFSGSVSTDNRPWNRTVQFWICY